MTRVLAAALLIGMVGCNGSSRSVAAPPGEAAQPVSTAVAVESGGQTASEVRRATLTIDGMVCQGCADAAKQTLEGVAGVVSAETDFQSGTATVSFDPSKTSIDALAATVEGVDREPAPSFRVTARTSE